MLDAFLCRAQDSLPGLKPWRWAFQHQLCMLSNSGLLKQANTLTWKFSKPFSASDWNVLVPFFFRWKIKIKKYLHKWLPLLNGTEMGNYLRGKLRDGGVITVGGGLWFGQVSGKAVSQESLRSTCPVQQSCQQQQMWYLTLPSYNFTHAFFKVSNIKYNTLLT